MNSLSDFIFKTCLGKDKKKDNKRNKSKLKKRCSSEGSKNDNDNKNKNENRKKTIQQKDEKISQRSSINQVGDDLIKQYLSNEYIDKSLINNENIDPNNSKSNNNETKINQTNVGKSKNLIQSDPQTKQLMRDQDSKVQTRNQIMKTYNKMLDKQFSKQDKLGDNDLFKRQENGWKDFKNIKSQNKQMKSTQLINEQILNR